MNNYKYAGLWIRICARLWDGLYLIPLMIVFQIIDFLLKNSESLIINMSFVISNIIYGLYFVLLLSSAKQATYGMIRKGIMIIDRAGNRILTLRSTLRYLLSQAPMLAFLITLKLQLIYSNFYLVLLGWLGLILFLPMLMYIHPKKQAYYDIICGTYVVYNNQVQR